MENSPWRRWHFPFDVEACTRELLDQGQGEYVLWCVVGVMDCDLLQASTVSDHLSQYEYFAVKKPVFRHIMGWPCELA